MLRTPGTPVQQWNILTSEAQLSYALRDYDLALFFALEAFTQAQSAAGIVFGRHEYKPESPYIIDIYLVAVENVLTVYPLTRMDKMVEMRVMTHIYRKLNDLNNRVFLTVAQYDKAKRLLADVKPWAVPHLKNNKPAHGARRGRETSQGKK